MRSSTNPYRWAIPLVIWAALQAAPAIREIAWDDIPPALHAALNGRGVDRATLPTYVAELRRRNAARMREGDLDHLVHYALQSTVFTPLPPIEPALSAREYVTGGRVIPRNVRSRMAAFVAAAQRQTGDERLRYFREMLRHDRPATVRPAAFVLEHYARAMNFLYEKEFGPVDASLYQQRGLSTDTSIDAGYLVYLALATLNQLEPARRVERVLVIGPGLDLAPRTGFVETAPPQSLQPTAVADALIRLGLSARDKLEVRAIDINPRVVDWIVGRRGTPGRLTVTSGVAETGSIRLTSDYRTYLSNVGDSIGRGGTLVALPSGHLTKSLDLPSEASMAVDATVADIVAERLDERYDLVVVTNVFPYLSDTDLLLALVNIERMLAAGGVLLHNEARPLLAEATLAVNLRLIHSRSAIIATVQGASPLYDAIWMHQR